MFSSLGLQLARNFSFKNQFFSLSRFNFKQNNQMFGFQKIMEKKFSSVYVNHRDTIDNNQNTPFDFTEENYKKVEEILVRNKS